MKDYKKQFKTFIQENHMTFITPGIQRRLYPFLNRLVDEARREGREETKKECIEMVWKYNCSEDGIAMLIEENISSL